MAVSVTNQQLVSALYVAIFNRAPDKAGLDSWVAQMAAGKSFAEVSTGFTGHEVFTQGIGTLSNAAYVNALYTNVLGSAGDAAGVAGWVALLNGGASKASIAASFVQAALTVDIPALLASGALTAADAAAAQVRQDTLTNKANVGIYFTTTLGAASNLNAATVTSSKAGLEADPIYNASKAAIANVTNAAASVQTAKDAIAVAAGSPNPAQSLLGGNVVLTVGLDNITGTAAADTYTGLIDGAATTTLTAADKINGGAGIDTLNVTVSAGISATNAADISNIEIINVRNVQTAASPAVALNAATTPGVTSVVSDRSTGALTVTGLAAGSTVGLKGNAVTALGAVTATYADAVTAANLTVDGGTATGTAVVSIGGLGLTSATVTSTGAANILGGVKFTSGLVKTVTVDAQSNVTTGNISGLAAASTITVKGTGTANIGALEAVNVTVLDASANTGGVTAVLNNVATLVATGGAGNDTFTTGGLLATGANVNAGAGTGDRLIISSTGHLTTASAAFYKGFEIVQVADGVTADVSSLAANNTITAVAIADGVGNTVVNGVTTAQAGAVQIVSTGTGSSGITLGLTGASNGGQIDTVKAALTTTTTAGVGQAIDLTDISLTGVEKLELTGTGTAAASTGAITLTTDKALALDSIIVKTVGTSFITIAAAQAANLVVDASGSTGVSTIDASAYNSTTGATLKGGSAADVITGSVKADVLTGGAGNDTFAFGTDGSLIGTAMDLITDFTAKTATAGDILTFGGATTVLSAADATALVAGSGAGSNVQTTAGGKVTFAAADNTLALKIAAVQNDTQLKAINTVAFFEDSGNTYVFNAGAENTVADDQLIQLTGVVGLTTIAAGAAVTIAA